MLSPSLPFAILGCGGILGAVLSLHLPETAAAELSNTLEEAEQFGKDRGFFYMPMVEQYGVRRRKGGGGDGGQQQEL